MGFMDAAVIANDQVLTVGDATLYHFGVMMSEMHMAWTRAVCGRLKSDYRYSKDIVYNNFPWPKSSEKHQGVIENAGQGVLDARAQHPNATLADLYDPLTMPRNLLKAHQRLDKAVDVAYGVKGFDSEAKRIAFLFEQYEKLTVAVGNSTRPSSKSRTKAM